MSQSNADGTVTNLFGDLKSGKMEAAEGLWEEYFSRLVTAARKRLGDVPRRVCDEEDIAISAFQSLCQGAARGRFQKHRDRDDLWRLLLCLTKQKVVDHIRREGSQKRGEGEVRGESVFLNANGDLSQYGIQQVVSTEPNPEFLAAMEEEHLRLLDLLQDDSLRQVAKMRFEGFSNEDIAAEFGLTVRSIERKLGLIRERWMNEIDESV